MAPQNLARLISNQNLPNFHHPNFYTSVVKFHMSIVISILQYFKYVPVKPESVTDERDEQLPEPNGSLSKSAPTKVIKPVSEC